MIKRVFIKLSVIALALAVTVTFTPLGAAPVSAEESANVPGIYMGVKPLEQGVNTDDAQIVWYGGKAWYVIGYNGDGNKAAQTAPKDGLFTLLSKESLGDIQFNIDYFPEGRPYEYGKSDLKKYNDNYYSGNNDKGQPNFNEQEKSLIVGRTLKHIIVTHTDWKLNMPTLRQDKTSIYPLSFLML